MTQALQLVLEPEFIALYHRAEHRQPLGLIALSHTSLTARFFNGDTINPARLEQAIEWAEDCIQAARLQLPRDSLLYTDEDDLRTLALASGVSPSEDMVLHVDAVEATFSRLAMQAFGQSAQQESLPRSARFFATVVFTRELMHHLHFPQIHVVNKFRSK